MLAIVTELKVRTSAVRIADVQRDAFRSPARCRSESAPLKVAE